MSSTRAAPASRLPSTRESRPALIGLAILLIVGGALASGYLALQAGQRAYFVRVDRGVAQGARITADDLGRVSLPENYAGGVRASEASRIVGQSATVRLLPGTVLAPAMVSRKGGIDSGQAQLTIPVDNSPFVQGLQPGAQLALNIGASGAGTAAGTGGNAGDARQSVYAQLVAVSTPEKGSGLGGGTFDQQVFMVVQVDASCISAVGQGLDDKSITPAQIGDGDNSAIKRTCGS